MKRMISMLLVLAMLFSMVPVGGWAEEATPEEKTVAQEEETEETTLPEETEETVPPEDTTEEPEEPAGETEEETVPKTPEEAPELRTWEDWTYRILDDGTVSLCGFHGIWDDTQKPFLVKVPAQIDHAPVTQIEAGAFAGNTQMEGALLPETVLTVGDGAFENCTQLKVIAFCGNTPIFETTLAKNSKNLHTVILSEGMDSTELDEVLTRDIGDRFQIRYVSGIDGVENTVTEEIKSHLSGDRVVMNSGEGTVLAKGKCGNDLTWVLHENGTMLISGSGDMWDGAAGTEYSAYKDKIILVQVESGITSIGRYAFNYYENIESVKLPETLTSIGSYAFNGCASLSGVSIPDSVTLMGGHAFASCSSLVDLKIGRGLLEISQGAFDGCSSLISVEIPDNIIEIGDIAFLWCSSLKNITIPSSVKKIGHGTSGGYSFANCRSLEDIYIPDSVTEMGRNTFEYCTALKRIRLSNGVSDIYYGFFNECWSLESIEIPEGVEHISDNAFKNCKSLREIKFSNTLTNISGRAFYNCRSLTQIDLPVNCNLAGSSYGYIFSGCTNLTTITMPISVTRICEGAFYQCPSIKDVYYAGTEEQWKDIIIESQNEDLLNATLHFSYAIPSGYICYFNCWDAENKIAYFGPGDMLGSQVTAETDAAFAENPVAYLGQYVLVETKPNAEDPMGPDILLSVKAVESKTGTVTAANSGSVTIDGVTYPKPAEMHEPESYVDKLVLYHIYNGVLVEVEALEKEEGILVSWDGESRLMGVNLGGAAEKPVYYTLSRLADKDSEKLLNSGTAENSSICYICDASSVVYSVALPGLCSGKCGDSLTWELDANGKLTIRGKGRMYDYSVDEKVYAPWYGWREDILELDIGEGVTSIGACAFCSLKNMKVVSLPATIPNIGEQAFRDSNQILKVLYRGSFDQWRVFRDEADVLNVGGLLTAMVVYGGHSLDIWSFANSENYFGNKGYYITKEDEDRLISDLTNKDRSAVTTTVQNLNFRCNYYNVDGNGSDYRKWSGSCYGMSVWICLVNAGVIDASAINPSVHHLLDYDLVETQNTAVESAINYYHTQQHLSQVKTATKNFQNNQPLVQINRLCSTANDSDCPFVINFQWKKVGKSGLHAVVGYGSEDIAATEIRIQNTTRTYTHRILIYDCAFPYQEKKQEESGTTYRKPELEDRNIYYNDNGEWCYPAYDVAGTFGKHASVLGRNNGEIILATNDVAILNSVDYRTGLFSGNAHKISRYSMLTTNPDAKYTVKWNGNVATVSGITVEGNENCQVVLDGGITEDGQTSAISATLILPEDVQDVEVISDQPMSFVFRDAHYYVAASTSTSGTIGFNQGGAVSVNTSRMADMRVSVVSDEGYNTLSWYEVGALSSNATSLSAHSTEDGIVFASDNLKNLTVRVSEGDNYTDTTISTKKDQILLTQDGQEPAIFEDSNGDGEFDRRLFDEDAIVDTQVQIQQDYIIMAVGSVATVVAQVTPDILLPYLQWSVTPIEGENVITVDQDGTIHAHNAGAAYAVASVTANGTTYTARCRVDVTEQKTSAEVQGVQLGTTSLTAELFRKDYASFDVVLLLEQNQSEIAAFAQSEASGGVAVTGARFEEETVDGLFELRVKDDRTLLVVPRQAALEAPKDVKSSYSSKVCLQIGEETFVTDQSLKLTVKKSMPKLKAAALSFNAFYTDRSQPIEITGGTVTAVIRDENMDTAKTSALPDWLELEDGRLTLNELAPAKAASGNVYVQVETAEWANPVALKIPVKLTYGAPKLKLSATSVTFASANSRGVTLKLQCGNRAETLESLQVEDAAAEGFDVTLDRDTGDLTLVPNGEITAGNKELWVSFADTARQLCLKWKAVVKAPVLTANPKSVTLNGIAGDGVQIPITVSPADYQIRSIDSFLADSKGNTLERGLLNFSFENGTMSIRTTEKTQPGSTYYLHIRIPEMPKDAVITVKTATQKQSTITVTAKASGSVDRSFPERAAVVTPTFRNYASGSFTLDSWTLREYEGKNLVTEKPENWEVSAQNGRIIVKAGQTANLNAKHNYTLDASLLLENGQMVQISNVKIPVKYTPVNLKLSKTSIALNPRVGDSDRVTVTCQTKDYDFQEPLVQLDGSGLDFDWADGVLTVNTNADTAFGTIYKVNLQAKAGEPVSVLTVKTPAANKAAVSAKLTAKGSIDVVRDGTSVVVTPKFTNCASWENLEPKLTVEWATSEKNASYTTVPEGMFTVTENEDGTFAIQKAPGAAPDLSYQYRAVLSFCGGNPAYGKLTLKSGTGKVTAAGSSVLYKTDRFSRGAFRLVSTDRNLNSVDRVIIKDARQQALFCIYDYGNGEYAIGFRDNTVNRKAKYPTSVTLNVFLEGNRSSKPNGTVTLKLAVR